MTKEEEKLLLTDLCSRIPYGVRVKFTEFSSLKDKELIGINTYDNDMSIVTCKTENGIITMPLKYVKPYLLPLSNLNDKQYEEYWELEHSGDMEHLSIPLLAWLNKNHFDYRGLIPMGLAIDATNLKIY